MLPLQLLAHTDIYLLDQIFKGRYQPGQVVLDAGAGGGRNLPWFVAAGLEVFGVDRDPQAVEALRRAYPDLPPARWAVADLAALPFPDAYFDHVVCSAVLHFADHHAHFAAMWAELVRVLRPGGSLWVRTATSEGLAPLPPAVGEGRYALADGTERYLLARATLAGLQQQHGLRLAEPFKTVLVEQLRSMAVVVLEKGWG